MGNLSLAVAGSKGALALALAITFGAALRFVKWLIEFLAARSDVGQTRLGQRLGHVEAELARYREATMLLVSAMAKKDPRNQVLREVARILSEIPPRPTMDLDELQRRLNDIPGRQG